MKPKIDKLFDRSDSKLKPFIIFEMANNHMGEVSHGLQIIKECSKISSRFNFTFAFKFQMRDMSTFIHPDFKNRMDIKYVKRFSETKLSPEQYKVLKRELKKYNFLSICTPFDESSVDLIEELKFDILKIGSCSFNDWPLLERAAKVDLPIIISTAGAPLDEIDKVVSFFQHRSKRFALMHCVGEYPTEISHLQLNQIDLLKTRYPDIVVGYSTHEDPSNFEAVGIAYAKGARIFEKHVGVVSEKYDLNSYSATPDQLKSWLKKLSNTVKMCGVVSRRHDFSEKEKNDLRQFQRGVFAKSNIKKGELIDMSNTFFAFPNSDDQIVANEMSRYTHYVAKKDFMKGKPILHSNISKKHIREKVYKIVGNVQKMISDARIALPNKLDFEISHHYGIEKFERFGAVLLNCINREYAKKLVVVMPGQKHPAHFHKKKEETFHILYGDFALYINNKKENYKAGDIVTIERGVMHSFSSKTGGIFEEVSTALFASDSFYEDETINLNKNRKTYLTFWI